MADLTSTFKDPDPAAEAQMCYTVMFEANEAEKNGYVTSVVYGTVTAINVLGQARLSPMAKPHRDAENASIPWVANSRQYVVLYDTVCDYSLLHLRGREQLEKPRRQP